MTIASTTVATPGSPTNGATTQFNFTFSVESYGAVSGEDQIEVILKNNTTGAETVLTKTTHYTVSLNANQNSNPGGSITTVSTYASGYTIYIRLAPSFLQATDYQNEGGFKMETVEDQADQQQRQINVLLDRIRRAPRVGIQAGASFDGEMDETPVAGYGPVIKSDLSGWQLGAPAGIGVSTAMTPVVQAATIDAAIALLVEISSVTSGSNSAADANASVINAAITSAAAAVASSGAPYAVVRLPPRVVVWSGAITLKAGVILDLNGSTLKAKNSLNANFIEGENTASLYSGSTAGGIYDAGIRNGTIDGNKANQTSGHALRVYGYKLRFESLHITNAKERAFSTKWGNPGLLASPPGRGLENIVRNLYIDFAGQEGLYHEGPNDSYYSDVFVVSCGQDTTNTYDNVVATGTYGHAHWTRLHSWRWSPEAAGGYVGFVYPRYALRVESEGNEFDSCDIEGGYTGNVLLTGGYNAFNATCAYYGVRAGGSNIIIKSSFNSIKGRLTSPESGSCKGIVLGTGSDTVSYNVVDVIASEQQSGVIDHTNSDGYNVIRMRGVNSAGTFQVGTRQIYDECDIYIGGAGGGLLIESGLGRRYTNGYLKRSFTSGISAAGSTQGDATALSSEFDIHYVGTVGSGQGVLLPNPGVGGEITVVNDDASGDALNVYPPSGHTIAGLSANAASSLPAGCSRTFFQLTTTFWLIKDEHNKTLPVSRGGTGDTGSAWTTTNPTVTAGSGSITSVSCTLAKKAIGKTLFFRAIITVTTNGTGADYLVLPMGETFAAVQTAAGVNISTGSLTSFTNGSDLRIFSDGFGYPAADGQTIHVSGVFELA